MGHASCVGVLGPEMVALCGPFPGGGGGVLKMVDPLMAGKPHFMEEGVHWIRLPSNMGEHLRPADWTSDG